jgi:hypothetical protein
VFVIELKEECRWYRRYNIYLTSSSNILGLEAVTIFFMHQVLYKSLLVCRAIKRMMEKEA